MISGIILAAGASRRMGTPKQSLELAGKPMLQYSVERFLESSLDQVILVVGPDTKWKKARRRGLRVVVNPSPGRGISFSVKVALDSISPRSEAAVIGLGDKPLLRASTIDSLIEAHRRSDAEIIVPVCRGRRGNPILFRKRLFPELRSLKGDVGAKVLVESKSYSVEEVPVDDVGVLLDVDVPADVQKVERLLSARPALDKRKAGK